MSCDVSDARERLARIEGYLMAPGDFRMRGPAPPPPTSSPPRLPAPLTATDPATSARTARESGDPSQPSRTPHRTASPETCCKPTQTASWASPTNNRSLSASASHRPAVRPPGRARTGRFQALVDTGATRCGVTLKVAEHLQIPSIGREIYTTVSGAVEETDITIIGGQFFPSTRRSGDQFRFGRFTDQLGVDEAACRPCPARMTL